MDDRDKAILEAVKRLRDLASAMEMFDTFNLVNCSLREVADDLAALASAHEN